MSDEEFYEYKVALAVKILDKPKGLMQQAYVYQMEIDTQEYNFNRAQIEAETLKMIVKSDIIQFYQVRFYSREKIYFGLVFNKNSHIFSKDRINRFGPKRRKLAVHVKSTLKNTCAENKKHSRCLSANQVCICYKFPQK